MSIYRNTLANEIEKKLEKNVKIAGWWANYRNHGGVIFGEIRDESGICQIVFEDNSKLMELVEKTPIESVVQVTGKVINRMEENFNLNLASGKYEIVVKTFKVLSKSKPLPFHISESRSVHEEIRLKYRFLDLRNETNQKILKLRSDVMYHVRTEMRKMDFTEVHTPILTASSPEGAREYVVFGSKTKGKCYVLPQAPQIFKQMLMVASVPRYFQIAPCFRDEDPRKDRAVGEFYQIDFEMSFATEEDVFKVARKLILSIFKKFSRKTIYDFVTMSYEEAINKYGSDKPDLRNPLIVENCETLFKKSDFQLFAKAIAEGKTVRGIRVDRNKVAKETTRGDFDRINEIAQKTEGFHLGYVYVENDEYRGPIGKFFTEEMKKQINLKNQEVMFFICDYEKKLLKNAGKALNLICQYFDLREKGTARFVFVKDFPMYEETESGAIDFSHNPFSLPHGGMASLMKQDPLTIKAHQYDIVCNGIELCSGAVRNENPECLIKAFEIAGYTKKEVMEKFPALVNALSYGAPPHAGAAPGFDRIIMLLMDDELENISVRDVCAFPLNGSGVDMLTGAPTYLPDKKMRELNLKILKEETKKGIEKKNA